ncbi:Lysine-specific demethylase 6A [Geodia barretti]|uniref:Lysine-specific demethylase 6A n=2 Tax=Geodia barretti TaxID=519541 RepID=A0AA35WP24_GEOBA|nr:Lysine-specific demethylase 6A [Geodia barretti]
MYCAGDCPETNLLSHIGHTVLGMNSVQLYMKVAGSRTPGHQENNNFCSLNINVGPGTCEWFAVPNSYWGVLHSLCEKYKVNFLIGSWWPVLEELPQHNIPVYRFTQYRGEVVFINPGTIHWVQANGVCNNIAWNTGPPTAHQFRMAWERYQWNKLQKVRSIVPMVHLTWNMARRIRLNDSHFYWQVRSLLESSLAQTNLLVSHLKKAGIPILWHGRLAGESAPYCNDCAEEVFNVLFVLSHRGEYLVYCHRCASSMRKTFTVLQQYDIEELKDILAMFSLHLPET